MAHFFCWQQKGLKIHEMQLPPELTAEIRKLVEDEGLELLAIEIHGSGSRMILRIVVDGPSGVTLERCSSISHQASAVLDVEDPFSHHYALEVSSPGLDRKFYRREDYERFAGRRVFIRMHPTYRRVRSVTGTLKGLSGDVVRLHDDTNETIELPLDQILETRLEIDWARVMKEGKTHR